MASATLTMRIDSELKKSASEVAEYYGFDLSSVTRAFYKQMVRDQAIPLNLGYTLEIPNDETIRAMKEAEYMIAHPGESKSYSTAEEMMADLLSDEGEKHAPARAPLIQLRTRREKARSKTCRSNSTL